MNFNRILFSAICAASLLTSAAYGRISRDEVVQELDTVRHERKALRMANTTHSSVKIFIDEMDEDKLLENTIGWGDYASKYATLSTIVPLLRSSGVDLVLLSRDNAPKTHALIEAVAEKMGMDQIPPIYVIGQEGFLNAFAAGWLQSVSVIGIGEKLVKECPNTEALEFLIAHELTHVKHRHVIKSMALSLASVVAINTIAQNYYRSLDPKKPEENLGAIAQNLGILVGTKLAQSMVQAWYSRVCERDADFTAAQTVGAQGGVDLMTMFNDKFETNVNRDFEELAKVIQESRLKDQRSFQLRVWLAHKVARAGEAIGSFLGYPFRTHPPFEERIENIKNSVQS